MFLIVFLNMFILYTEVRSRIEEFKSVVGKTCFCGGKMSKNMSCIVVFKYCLMMFM